MSVPKFRKKPVTIAAVEWRGDNLHHVRGLEDIEPFAESVMSLSPITRELLIDTLEGTMRASIGDWIIRGVKGELYPCKPDIFAETYERVEE